MNIIFDVVDDIKIIVYKNNIVGKDINIMLIIMEKIKEK